MTRSHLLLFDMDMRKAWHGQATLTNGLKAHVRLRPLNVSEKNYQLPLL